MTSSLTDGKLITKITGSTTHANPMYPVPLTTPGRLFLMPHPDPRCLERELETMHNAGVNLVVSLLDGRDISELGLEPEGEICAKLGLDFINHPIVDYGLPSPEPFAVFVGDLAAKLEARSSIAIHCRAGVGRTGMLACCVLKHLGQSTEDAIDRVSEARTTQVPETSEQRRFVAAYSKDGFKLPPADRHDKPTRSPSQD